MKVKIVEYSIVKMPHRTRGKQYGLRLRLDNGDVFLKRLKGMHPTATCFKQETEEKQIDVNRAALNVVQNICVSAPRPRGKYKKCDEAIIAYNVSRQANGRCNPRKFDYVVRRFNEYFGDKPLTYLTSENAGKFVEHLIEKGYSYDTVRLIVVGASGMISWLREQGYWPGVNPFCALMRRYANRFPAREPAPSTINNVEYDILLKTARELNLKAAISFIEISRCTGIRPSEIFRLDTKHLDREQLTWTLLVTKTSSRPYYRTIAIPQYLVSFITNDGMTSVFPYSEKTVIRQINRLRKETSVEFTMKTFRKDFSHRMEAVEAPPDVINLHQGRGQRGVLYKNYLTDPSRPVRLCRPYINAMFGEKIKLAIVK